MSSGASGDGISSISTTSSELAADSLSSFSLKDLTVDDISSLLESLDLDVYVELFREKKINGKKINKVETIDDLKEMKIEIGRVDYRTLFEAVDNIKANGVPKIEIDTWRRGSKSIGSGSGSGSRSGSVSVSGSLSTKDVSLYSADPIVVFANTFWAENNAGVRKVM